MHGLRLDGLGLDLVESVGSVGDQLKEEQFLVGAIVACELVVNKTAGAHCERECEVQNDSVWRRTGLMLVVLLVF